jgi:hypothetical protein
VACSHVAAAERRKAVISDIDGTLASSLWRSRLVDGDISGARSWDEYFEAADRDRLIVDTLARVMTCVERCGAALVIVTGRPQRYRYNTEFWLGTHDILYDELWMRADGDWRRDVEIKRDIYAQEVEPRYEVAAVFEDRASALGMYRGLGLAVVACVDPGLPPECLAG